MKLEIGIHDVLLYIVQVFFCKYFAILKDIRVYKSFMRVQSIKYHIWNQKGAQHDNSSIIKYNKNILVVLGWFYLQVTSNPLFRFFNWILKAQVILSEFRPIDKILIKNRRNSTFFFKTLNSLFAKG